MPILLKCFNFKKLVMKLKIGFVLFFVAVILNARDFDRAKMDSLFFLIEQNDCGMGSFSLFEDGKEVYAKTYGYAVLDKKQKPDVNTRYRIASISKSFTATIVMKLIEEGKLRLDDKLDKYYPQIENANEITIEMLLRHRSGIYNLTNANDYLEWHTQKFTKDQLLGKIYDGGSLFMPNQQFAYSNSNYILLTFVIEDVTKDSFANALEKYIVKPCDLKNTFVGSVINIENNEALSYTKLGEWKLEEETDMSIPLGAGFLVSTPTDLNKFYFSLFREKIVNKHSLGLMTQVQDNFGLGLFRVPFYSSIGYGHSGGLDGFHSNAYYFPDEKIGIAVTSNGLVFPLNDIVKTALEIYTGKDTQLPQFDAGVTLTEEDLSKYLGVYSSEALPLKFTIGKDGNVLTAQLTGQPSFPLECFEVDKFRFTPAKVVIEFYPGKNTLILKQGGAELLFIR